jgi:hypothetical protein
MQREIAKVVNHVKMDDEDSLDVAFWQAKSMAERLQEVIRLRKNYYTWLNGSFPDRITKVVTTRLNDF